MTSLSQPATGELFEGRYRLGKLIGEGGFSRVYHAVDPAGRPVALKLLTVQASGASGEAAGTYARQMHERFLREARLLEQLDDPHIIRMYDFGRSAQGVPYMAFEYLQGRSLFAILRDEGALSPQRALNVLRQTLLGLRAAHGAGILHRDIKPTNIMVLDPGPHEPDERIKLLDFGIAKAYGEHTLIPGNELTAAGTLVGTPRYMSPEQLRSGSPGAPLGPASDLYSLGLVSIEMLTGRKLIAARDRVRLIEAHLSPAPFRVPPELTVADGLRAVIHRMAEKSLEARFRNADEVLRDLDDLLASSEPTVGLTAPNSGLRVAPPQAPDEDTVLQTINEAALEAAMAASAGEPTLQQPIREAALEQTRATTRPPPSTPSAPTTVRALAPRTHARREAVVPEQAAGQADEEATAASAGQGRSLSETLGGLTSAEKTALVLSLLLPGSGHLLLGQPLKGAAILVGLVLTLGLGYLLALGVAFDALLVLRARRKRPVGALELLPELDQVLRF